MKLRVCEHLEEGSKGRRSVIALSKEGSRLILCCACYLSPTGCTVMDASPQYFKALLREIELAPKPTTN